MKRAQVIGLAAALVLLLSWFAQAATAQAASKPTLHKPTDMPQNVNWIDVGNGLSFYYYFAEDKSGRVWQFGEMHNFSDAPQNGPDVNFKLLDANQNVVGYSQLSPLVLIQPGESVPMSWPLNSYKGHLGDWAAETYDLSYPTPDTQITVCSTDLVMKDLKVDKQTKDQLQLSGKIQNHVGHRVPTPNAVYDHVTVDLYIYRSDGRMAGLVETEISKSLAPGDSGSFKISAKRDQIPGLDVDPKSDTYTYQFSVYYLPDPLNPTC
jgi:hypothetical protein